MHHVAREDQRNAQARFFDCDALQPRCGMLSVNPDQAAEPSGAKIVEQVVVAGIVRMKPPPRLPIVSCPIFSASVISRSSFSMNAMMLAVRGRFRQNKALARAMKIQLRELMAGER